ncbi:LacI family DNA-binding transcriptional regulator [Kaistia nematophila]|uniref:LacI family DNA-binding transcriptional regulator n=1 Tax=Kaistia nematophila TaxID=2994654 RepID=A0A9X3IM63_9HYPH|nr:LacI family DNA-binding transcriptional regulator [Kaistia nematophila]MCX5569555.1 LacI family DNA-binding transcriptional regulator [Kaistia nematophila]
MDGVNRPTIRDLAEAAGVGVATVDRVLNRRAPVKRETAERVLAAAEAIGYHGTGLLKRRLEETAPDRSFGFLLQRRADAFFQEMAAALSAATRAAPGVRGKPVVEFVEDISAGTVAEKLLALGARVDALAVVAADHPKVTEAVERLAARGVGVMTLLSELSAPGRIGHVGIDHRKAGRTAAWAVSRLVRQAGSVGSFVGSHRFVGHELAESSFRAYFREHAPAFRLLEPLANLEDPHLAHEGTLELLKRNPDLVGIYVAGGGMAGLVTALREAGAERRVVAVCNELVPETRAALVDGVLDAVIATPVRALAERAVEILTRATTRRAGEGDNRVLLPFELYVAENV